MILFDALVEIYGEDGSTGTGVDDDPLPQLREFWSELIGYARAARYEHGDASGT